LSSLTINRCQSLKQFFKMCQVKCNDTDQQQIDSASFVLGKGPKGEQGLPGRDGYNGRDGKDCDFNLVMDIVNRLMQLEATSLGQQMKLNLMNEEMIKHELLIKQLKISNIDLENQVKMHQEHIKFVVCSKVMFIFFL